MPSEEQLFQYARVLVRIGLRVEESDRLLVRAGTHAAPLVHQVAAEAYRAGAANVDVLWIDDTLDRARLIHGSSNALRTVSYHAPVMNTASEHGDLFLRIVGEPPDRVADLDGDRVGIASNSFNQATDGFFRRQISLQFIWTVAAAPSRDWARLVFPKLSEEDALESLWTAVLATVRADQPDPVAAWEAHLDHLDARKAAMNQRDYRAIHYSGPGTDLTVGLPVEHCWNHPGEGSNGRRSVAGMPVEEVATTPHRDQAEGTIRISKPLAVGGRLISGINLRFKGGVAVEASAESGQDDLERLLAADEGARRLGEVALVPQSSAVARQKLVWYETVFDENDASHIALGAGYPMGIDGGMVMSPDELAGVGVNQSQIHEDLVVGSVDVTISGVNDDGSTEPLIEGGEWTFEV